MQQPARRPTADRVSAGIRVRQQMAVTEGLLLPPVQPPLHLSVLGLRARPTPPRPAVTALLFWLERPLVMATVVVPF